MRTAFVSLIALAGLATAAHAQPAPEAAPPAAPAAEPAPAAAPAPAADEKSYVLPTSGPEGQIIDVINRVCKPLVKGGDFKTLAGGMAGYKLNKREGTYVGTLVEKPYTLTIWPQGSNKDVCRLTLSYAVNGEKPIIVGLNIFSFLHKPELVQQRNDFVPATDYKRITNSWEYFTDKESIGLVFLQLKKPDGSSAGKNADLGEVLYSERKF
ncbi:hypothetical protein [Phenylobacterium sp.]|uniref:hypothetical protein n=1 Tax=Phenylobacterium sp. TaxID=1871053 RepID=UPI0025FCEE83|nr:hypothetical protein [Phenylobacterium sp.]